jgi:hypothetical protein
MIPLDRLSKPALVRRLRDAYVCCCACGDKYGEYTMLCSSWWRDQCNVCGNWANVTETRDFGYLRAGIEEALK